MNQLTKGIKIEREHKQTIKFIESYYKKHKSFPTNKKIFTSIARDHLKEDPKYYSKLKNARL